MTTLTATNAKSKFLSLVRRAHDLHESYEITHQGRAYAVIMSNEDYDGLLETIDILKNKTLSHQLLQSVKRADKSQTLSFEQVAGRKQAK